MVEVTTMTDPRVRGWVFTLNNPESNAIEWPATIRYATWQLEKGENGTPHLQGYMEFNANQRMSACKKIMPKAHFEPRKGTREQAKAYANKEESRQEGPWEHGTFETEQGKRSDLEAVADRIKEGATVRQIAEEHPAQFIKYHKGLTALKSALAKPRSWKTKVIVRWGEPGSGKTRWVYDNYEVEDVYVKPPGDWYDGYDGHKVVLIDDFYGDIKYTELLRILDRYQMTVPVKGGFVNWSPETIIITSNAPPEDWYRNIMDKRALLRRIEEVVKVGASDYAGHEKNISQENINASPTRQRASSQSPPSSRRRSLRVSPRKRSPIRVRQPSSDSGCNSSSEGYGEQSFGSCTPPEGYW